ncbi:MAG: histidine kinase [Nonlabens sp.]
MKLRLGQFIGWFYLVYFVMEVLRDVFLRDNFLEQFYGDPMYALWITFRSSLLFLAYALFSYLFLNRLYKRVKTPYLIAGLILIAVSIIGLRFLIEEVIIKAITGYGNYYEGTTAWYYVADNLYYAILYTSFGICWYFARYSIFKDQQQQLLLLENKKTELSFLKSQVNPHFLFNMLNNIYALINMGSDKALMATDKLSQLLRYSLYESETMVTVDQEIQAINDYISLQELRFRESVQTAISIDSEIFHHEIAPFLLMPLVENSFKHGVVTDPENPIKIDARKENDSIVMTIANKIAHREKDEVGGIGIENLRKRLDLIYGDRHSYEQEVTDEHFKIIIKIKEA